jgi:hypothetical protein
MGYVHQCRYCPDSFKTIKELDQHLQEHPETSANMPISDQEESSTVRFKEEFNVHDFIEED